MQTKFICGAGYLSGSRINSLLIRQSNKYLVLTQAGYPAADLDDLAGTYDHATALVGTG